MRVLRRVLALLLVAAVVGAVVGYRHYRPLLVTGTGYAAHNACAVTLVAGRDDPEDDLPPNPLVPYLTGYVNLAGHSATSAVGWLFAKQKAWYSPGYGCTVATDRPEQAIAPTAVDTEGNPLADAPTPKAGKRLTAALARAFGDDLDADAREELGTRGVVVVKDGELLAERYADGFDVDTPSSAGRWPRARRTCSSGGTSGTASSTSRRRPCARSGPTSGRTSPSTS
ncbi:hypothetical protein H9L10_14255 [Phycicoccus endophyticus]|uniref:Uncharacterized protein n=1 Tax=Phycicoccus endophyticus TaxID=1690220 RepID=A0A7G9R6B4_9MICO|nr:hypothetical protein [Phycicoccus endophyticus]QNN51139.1 hypothetical protein H9L10_14255 [Phycicoccus endophyticus]